MAGQIALGILALLAGGGLTWLGLYCMALGGIEL